MPAIRSIDIAIVASISLVRILLWIPRPRPIARRISLETWLTSIPLLRRTTLSLVRRIPLLRQNALSLEGRIRSIRRIALTLYW